MAGERACTVRGDAHRAGTEGPGGASRGCPHLHSDLCTQAPQTHTCTPGTVWSAGCPAAGWARRRPWRREQGPPSRFQAGVGHPSIHPAAVCSPPLPTKYTHTHPFVPPPLIHSSTNVSIHPSISPSLSCTHPSTHPPPSPIRLRVSGYPRTTHHQSVNLAMHLVFPSVNRSLCMRVWCPRTGASLP